ncbi:ATPase [Citrobacter koseri]
MSNKILNPIVLIHKRENSDTYAVAITSGSQDYHDAVLMATMEPDMAGDNVDTWSKTGYYMAEEIQRLRQQLIAPLSIGELIQRLESQTGDRWERVVNDVTDGKPLTAGTSVSFTIDELSAMFSWMIPPYVVTDTHTDEFNELRNKIFSALRDARHRGTVDE